MMIVGMMFEMLSAGLVVPIIGSATNEKLSEKISFELPFLSNAASPAELILWVVLLISLIYLVKNCYLGILNWYQSRFVYSTQIEMANTLFGNYLNKPYSFHLERNSAELINNLQVELNLFIVHLLSPSMILFAETLVLSGLMGILLYFEPVGAITVFSVFLLSALFFQFVTKRKINFWGKQRQKHEVQRMKHAQQGLGAVKEAKIFSKERYLQDQYATHTQHSLTMQQRNTFLHGLTRLWLETLAIFGIAILYFTMNMNGKSLDESIPILALFAAVSFRLMPSANRIVSALHQLRFGVAVIDVISNEFSDISTDRQNESENLKVNSLFFKSRINFNNITYSYPDVEKNALKNINLEINKGAMVGLVGKSGSGKSTLVDCMLGLLKPLKGSINVDGINIETDLVAWRRLIGYVPQTIYLNDDTFKRNIAFGIKDDFIDEKALEKAIHAAQLSEFIDSLPEGIDTMLGERGVKLSGGQRQRIGIARALYHNPEILILDEATSALDGATEKSVMEAVEGLHGDKTILIIAHRLSTLENCDVIYQMNDGSISKKGIEQWQK
jgi:ABC-type multidrug transport system fused ATPase/permease subunit